MHSCIAKEAIVECCKLGQFDVLCCCGIIYNLALFLRWPQQASSLVFNDHLEKKDFIRHQYVCTGLSSILVHCRFVDHIFSAITRLLFAVNTAEMVQHFHG